MVILDAVMCAPSAIATEQAGSISAAIAVDAAIHASNGNRGLGDASHLRLGASSNAGGSACVHAISGICQANRLM